MKRPRAIQKALVAAAVATHVRATASAGNALRGDDAAARGASIGAVAPLSISTLASAMSRSRSRGSFFTHRFIRSTMRGGVDAGTRSQSGSFVITATMKSVTSSPANARAPVSIS